MRVEVPTVGYSCQRVGLGATFGVLEEAVEGGDVTLHCDIELRLTILVAKRRDTPFHHEFRSITAIVHRPSKKRAIPIEVGAQTIEHLAIRTRPLEDARGHTDEFVCGIAGHPAKRRVGVHDPRPWRIEHDVCDHDGIERLINSFNKRIDQPHTILIPAPVAGRLGSLAPQALHVIVTLRRGRDHCSNTPVASRFARAARHGLLGVLRHHAMSGIPHPGRPSVLELLSHRVVEETRGRYACATRVPLCAALATSGVHSEKLESRSHLGGAVRIPAGVAFASSSVSTNRATRGTPRFPPAARPRCSTRPRRARAGSRRDPRSRPSASRRARPRRRR